MVYGAKAMRRRVRPGDHIVAERTWGPFPFEHHGIYVGKGIVVQLLKKQGICWTNLNRFGTGDDMWIRSHPHDRVYDPSEVAGRALDSLDLVLPYRYHMLEWNCEHFANWCVTGVLYSYQVMDKYKNLQWIARVPLTGPRREPGFSHP